MMEWCAAWLHPMTIQSELSALQTVRIVIILLTVTAVSLFFYRKYRYERKRGEEVLVEDDSVDGYVPVSKFVDAIALFCSEGGRNKPGVPFEILVRLGDEKEEEQEEQRGETSTDYLKEVTLEPTVTKNVAELLKELKELQSRSRQCIGRGTRQRRVRFSENIEVREFESLFMHLSRKTVEGGLSERTKETYKFFVSPSERDETIRSYYSQTDCESRSLLEYKFCSFYNSLDFNVNSEIRNCKDENGKHGKAVLLHYKDRADHIASNSVTFGMVLERKALERGRKAYFEAALIYQEDQDLMTVPRIEPPAAPRKKVSADGGLSSQEMEELERERVIVDLFSSDPMIVESESSSTQILSTKKRNFLSLPPSNEQPAKKRCRLAKRVHFFENVHVYEVERIYDEDQLHELFQTEEEHREAKLEVKRMRRKRLGDELDDERPKKKRRTNPRDSDYRNGQLSILLKEASFNLTATREPSTDYRMQPLALLTHLKEVTLEPTITKNVAELLKELKDLQSRSTPTGTSQRRVHFSEHIEVREFESLFMHLSRKKVKGGLSERRKESYKYFFSPSEREETEDYLFEGDCESRCLLENMLCPFEESLNRNVNSEIRNCIDEEGKEGKVVLLHYKDRADQIASNSVTFGMVLERKALERGRKARLEAALIYQEVDNDHVVVDDDDFEDSFADSSDFLEDDAAVEEEILPPKESPRQSRSSPSPRRRSQRLAFKGLGSGFTPSGRRFSRRLASLA